MRTTVLVIAAILSSAIALGTLFQMYVLLWRPELAAVPKYEHRKWPSWKRALMYASIGATFIGVGYMIYKGIEGALWFIPKSWRRINDDGESEWVVHGIAVVIAGYGSIALLSKLSDFAADKANAYWSRPPSER
jgi:hypothetical protein